MESQASDGASLSDATVIELPSLRADPARFEWFQFKPGVKKLILSGTPDARHVSILWYGYEGKPGAVPRHFHAKTESIFVIDGAQSDPRGTYAKGSFYFNPPGSAHDVFDSAGLFLLSYAAPPDFAKAESDPSYRPVLVANDYSKLAFAPCAAEGACASLPLSAEGGMTARFTRPVASTQLRANVLLLLQGSCTVAGQPLSPDTLVVAKSTEPASYAVSSSSHDCLIYSMAFE